MSIQAAIDLAVEDHKAYCRTKGMVGYDYEHVDSLRAAQSELSQPRQLCLQQHEALKSLAQAEKIYDDDDPLLADARDSAKCAIREYTKVMESWVK